MTNLEYQAPRRPRRHRPFRFGWRTRVVVAFGLVVPLLLFAYVTYGLHDRDVLIVWPFVAVCGVILGWLLVSGIDTILDLRRDRIDKHQASGTIPGWRERLNNRAAQIAACLLAVAIVGALQVWLLTFAFFGNRVADPAVIERNGGFRLTPGVHDVSASIDGWQDPTFRARLVLKPADLPAFLKFAAVTQPLASPPISDELTYKSFDHYTKRWWTPRLPPSRYEAGDGTWIYKDDEGNSWNRKQFMLIDETDPAQYIIWIVAFADD